MVCDKLPFSAGNSRERAFVQRQATLKGTQTWTGSGETATLLRDHQVATAGLAAALAAP